jgi:phosphomannomutase
VPERTRAPGRARAAEAARRGGAGRIRFGTSGWRGVLGEEFHFAGARALALAVARMAGAPAARPRILVAHDTRFLGERLAEEAAAVLAGAGARPLIAGRATPTPVVNFALGARRGAAALVFTASHNPPAWQGLKVLLPWGGGAPDAVSRRLAAAAERTLARGEPPRGAVPAARFDAVPGYLDALLRLLGPLPHGRRLRVVYDALHGCGAGVLDRALAERGVRVEVLRGDPDPHFGGIAPDPTPARLAGLARRVRDLRGLRLGLASDGDADRLAAVDASGAILSETELLALLVDHLARTGRATRGVAVSVATGSFVERVARHYGLACVRRPIGFKHLTAALVSGEADVAGEESRGFAWAPFTRDKDAILAAALLAEIVASSGAPLASRLAELAARHGAPACGRLSFPLGARARAAYARLARSAPRRFDAARVLGVEDCDGFRLALEDGFVLWRPSGTEPLLRVYAEAPTRRALARRLAAAAARVAGR